MNRMLAAVLLAAALAPPAAHAQAAGDAAPDTFKGKPFKSATLKALIDALRSDDPETRDHAARALAAGGDPARDAVAQALEALPKDELDQRARLKEVLKGIEDDASLRSFDRPCRASFAWKGKTVREALAELEKAYGHEVQASPEAAAQKISANELKDATFFEALEALRDSANLAYEAGESWAAQEFHGAFTFRLVPRPEGGKVYAKVCGPFLAIYAEYIVNRHRSFDLDTNRHSSNGSVRAMLRLYAEPGVPVCRARFGASKLVDAKGRKVTSLDGAFDGFHESFLGPAFGRCFHYEMTLDPNPEVHPPLAWTFRIDADIPTRVESQRIGDLSSAPTHVLTTTEGKLTVGRPEKGDGGWTVFVALQPDEQEAQDDGGGGLVAPASARGAVGVGPARTTPVKGAPTRYPGIFWLDEKGYQIDAKGQSEVSVNGQAGQTFTFDAQPRAMVVNFVLDGAKRFYEGEIKGLPGR